jgi:hypothetical protein
MVMLHTRIQLNTNFVRTIGRSPENFKQNSGPSDIEGALDRKGNPRVF